MVNYLMKVNLFEGPTTYDATDEQEVIPLKLNIKDQFRALGELIIK